MVKNTPGWAIGLKGEKIDLDDLRLSLTQPFEPWVEEYSTTEGSIPLLRSGSWRNLNEAAEVFRDAARLIERINGASLLVHADARRIELGEVMKFAADGSRQHILFASTGHFKLTGGRVRGRAPAIAGPPQESNVQRWLREAETDDTRAELLAHLSRADNWYDLYKSAELIRRVVGGARALASVVGTDGPEWDRIWRTANCYRHAPDPIKYPLPPHPATLTAAREFLFRVISHLL